MIGAAFALRGSKIFPLKEAPLLEAMRSRHSFQDFSWVCVNNSVLATLLPSTPEHGLNILTTQLAFFKSISDCYRLERIPVGPIVVRYGSY